MYGGTGGEGEGLSLEEGGSFGGGDALCRFGVSGCLLVARGCGLTEAPGDLAVAVLLVGVDVASDRGLVEVGEVRGDVGPLSGLVLGWEDWAC